DALKAQSLLAMLDNKLVTTERQQLNAIAQVHALLAVPPYTPWGAWAEVELPDQIRQMDAVLQQVQAESQEFLKAARDVELMQTMVRMAETMLYPRASTGASQVAPSLGAEAGPTRQAMAAFPPLPVVSHEAAGFGANAAYINELRIRVTQAHSLFDEATARTAFLAQDAHYRVDVSRRDVRTLAGTVVPRAQQALAATRAQYAAGRASLSDVLEASRAHVEAAFMLAEARRERNKALVDLQDATGRTVSRLLTGSTP
ncbi:MAG: hypothetical protein FJZ47_22730, partial [Candidatus Tectomicrobia bacterium]|nr:hypothetical protein [Candidatus Tectomicrobia bacterium]